MAGIRIEIIQSREGIPTLLMKDSVEERRVTSIDDVRRLVVDRGDSLTPHQLHGLGTALAVIAAHEYSGQYSVQQLGKVLDAVYFPTRSPEAGTAFYRGLGEALFALARNMSNAAVLLSTAANELIGEGLDENGA